MQRINKAIIIGRQILSRQDKYWNFQHLNRSNNAFIIQEGWSASVWTRRSCEQPGCASSSHDRPKDGAAFLECCRQLQCAYVLDLWLNGEGKVLSAEWDGTQFKLISFKRGPWEADYFGLPSPAPSKALNHVVFPIMGNGPRSLANYH
jgi:hypothetical protein